MSWSETAKVRFRSAAVRAISRAIAIPQAHCITAWPDLTELTASSRRATLVPSSTVMPDSSGAPIMV